MNILFGLFYYVNSLVNKDKKIWPLIIANIIFIVLLVVTIVAWHNGWVEKRDIRINSPTPAVKNVQTERS